MSEMGMGVEIGDGAGVGVGEGEGESIVDPNNPLTVGVGVDSDRCWRWYPHNQNLLHLVVHRYHHPVRLVADFVKFLRSWTRFRS